MNRVRSRSLVVTLIALPAVMWVALLAAGLSAAGSAAQICEVPAGYGTIQAAVTDPACDVVQVAAGVYAEHVVITRSVTVQGAGMAETIVDGGGSGTVFNVVATGPSTATTAVTVTLAGLGITDGQYGVVNSPGEYVASHVIVVASDVSFNAERGIVNGASLFSTADMTVIDSNISYNLGGGIGSSYDIRFANGRLVVSGSAIFSNSATLGGGIWAASPAEILNTTISHNTAISGGGLYVCTGTDLASSTLFGNSAAAGGGVYVVGHDEFPYGCHGTLYALHTIAAGSPGGDDCYLFDDGVFVDDGYNIVQDGTCISEPTSSADDPLLGPLQDNGGPTLTQALLPGSPALDSGDNAVCPAVDQRGVERPQDGDEDGTADCDIGAYERAYQVVVLPVILLSE